MYPVYGSELTSYCLKYFTCGNYIWSFVFMTITAEILRIETSNSVHMYIGHLTIHISY